MPKRLVKSYGGQAANTLYWGADQDHLVSLGVADSYVELASDFVSGGDRIVTDAAATTSQQATTYRMNSGSAQTLTVAASGYWPKDAVLTVIQEGAGATTVQGASGVTISGVTETTGANHILQLVKGAGETWVGVGG